ncbi:extensin-like [Portunus trituberculatus]|uniref:extensin-like n=1 Tax=Portunus trituberculatus TaxID=210409 RepID=UPI001E1CD60B|nr:extensin-like [Portunus trituberculatus]
MHAQVTLLVTMVAVALALPEHSYDVPTSPSPLFGARARPATASRSSSAPLSFSPSNTVLSGGFIPSSSLSSSSSSSSSASPSRAARPSRPSSSSQDAGYSYNAPPDAGYSYTEPRQGPAQYDTQYVVSDAEFGTNFGQQESRDGDDVSGTYYVQLPDGRLQVVTYTVSAETGYVAEVTYEGQTTTAAPTYAAPPSTYGQPSSDYGVPSSDYGVPSSVVPGAAGVGGEQGMGGRESGMAGDGSWEERPGSSLDSNALYKAPLSSKVTMSATCPTLNHEILKGGPTHPTIPCTPFSTFPSTPDLLSPTPPSTLHLLPVTPSPPLHLHFLLSPGLSSSPPSPSLQLSALSRIQHGGISSITHSTMAAKIALLLSLVAVAVARPSTTYGDPTPSYHAPAHPTPSYHAPAHPSPTYAPAHPTPSYHAPAHPSPSYHAPAPPTTPPSSTLMSHPSTAATTP